MPEVSIDLSGTATFAEETCVAPTRTSQAPFGRFVLVRSKNPISPASRDNLKLSAADPACWRLHVHEYEVILHSVPLYTLIMIR